MKKTRTIASALLISTFVLGAASTASAAPTVVASPTTDATVKFKAEEETATGGGNTTDPTNPDGNGVKPNPGEGSESTKGPLRINFAPNFKFGEVTMSGDVKTYSPLYTQVSLLDASGKLLEPAQSKFVPHYVEVADNRGTNEGWQLNVSATPFKDSKDQDLNATLTLNDATLSSAVHADLKPGTVSSSVVLNTTPQPLVTATANQGMGTWSTVFSKVSKTDLTKDDRNSSVLLKVPAESKKDPNETYTSKITWTLETTPTATK
ncbi:hypothetical protein DOK67_0002533 [Enterococcus sp. DIV0212c]|uniref:WxL domain-containing protein n=1 Tax=Enterococcus sp. DIV0212c TaxID=2230867 RepID=UPI001A9AC46A|nr:WxL domain-containing protein [Enterococcus sp. DIV0212c]MBO1353537.1 WxL domain-containing protein [Enterococcus sp. DIV0212c]